MKGLCTLREFWACLPEWGTECPPAGPCWHRKNISRAPWELVAPGTWALSRPPRSTGTLKCLAVRACPTAPSRSSAAGGSLSPGHQALPWGWAKARPGHHPIGQAQLSGAHEQGLAGQGCGAVGTVAHTLDPQLESSSHKLVWALATTSPQCCLGAAPQGKGGALGCPGSELALTLAARPSDVGLPTNFY